MTIKLDIISLAVDADMNPVVKEFAKDKIVIGRGKNVDLNLDADDISSKHAIIYVNDDGTLEIEDLGSLNGTSVGDKRISPHERFQIGKKDRIMIGDYLIKASFIKDEKESEVEAQDVKENTKKVSKKDTKTQAKQKENIKEESKPQENEVKLQEEVKEEIKEEETSDNTNVQNEQEKIEDLENSDDAEKISLEEILEDATVLNNEDKNQDEIFPEESIIDDEEATSISNEMIEDLEMENIIGNESLLEENQDESYDNIFELDEDLFDEKNEASSDSKNIIVNEAKESQEEIILESQKKLIEEDNKEISEISNNSNSAINTSNNTQQNSDSFLIISGTANENIFDINLEAIKLLTLEGQCKRFGVAIPDVIVTFNEEKAITDNNGRFKFTDIEENTPVTLHAEKSGYAFELKNSITSLTDNTQVIFEGIKTCYISGKILYKGKGLEGVLITNNLGKNVLTSQDGSFCIKDIKEGMNYFIKPEKENYIFDIEPEERTLKEDATFIINATKLITISGYIKYKGVPIENVIIDAGELGKTLTDKNGYYEFKNIKEGTQYSIKAYKEGFKFQKA